jgi:two-component system CheB/CheR fusion protein
MELTEMNNDVENLLTGSGIEILILDENLEIRKCSPGLSTLFNILEKDIGRPISHLSHNIVDFDIINAIESVQRTKKLFSINKQLADGSQYLIRILPYNIGPDAYSGTILTFVNQSELQQSRAALKHHKKLIPELIESLPSEIFIFKKQADNQLLLDRYVALTDIDAGNEQPLSPGLKLYQIWPDYKPLKLQSQLIKAMDSHPIYLIRIPGQEDRSAAHALLTVPLAGNRLAVIKRPVTESYS